MIRGSIHISEHSGGRRPVVLVTRDWALPILSSVTVAEVTTMVRGVPTEVPVGPEHGLSRDSVINCDNIMTVPKRKLASAAGVLGPSKLRELDDALRLALGLD